MNRTWKPTHFHDKLEGVYPGLELSSSKQEASPNRGVNTKAFECTTVFQRLGTRESFLNLPSKTLGCLDNDGINLNSRKPISRKKH